MISVAEALEKVLSLLGPLPCETVPLGDAAGRVLARPVVASRDQPPFASSAMDGYALAGDAARPGARFRVIGEAAAGHGFSGKAGPGETVRIFTGAPLPAGTDRVIIQEDVCRNGDEIVLNAGLDQATYVRRAGADFATGDRIEAPLRLLPSHLALAASMNAPLLEVTRRPVVALIATGDELVMPGESPRPDQIIASNSFGLKAMLETEGAEARMLPIARDNAASLRAAFALAEDADLIITIGGASVGDHDLVATTAAELGMEAAFYKVAMRPGKPLMAGQLRGIPMVGLPGNPVSAMVCAHVLLVPAVRAMLGLGSGPLSRRRAPLAADLGGNGPREHYMRARRDPETGALQVFERQDSALLSVLAQADALVVRAPGAGPAKAGETVDYLPFGPAAS